MTPRNAPGRDFRISAALVLCCIAPTAAAQTPTKPATVHAVGHHEAKLEPQKLRLTLSIRAEGTDAKSAIEAFLAHKERVKKELVAMKAEEASIEFDAAQLSSGISGIPAEMGQYESRIIAQLSRSQSKIDPEDIPKVFQATARVRAEWALPTTDADALALLPESLAEQVRARDLAGEKNKAKLEGNQQEKLEEIQAAMQENMGYYSGDDETSPLSVLFIAKIDDDSRKKAIQVAYESAVAQAQMLSTVAGMEMSDLLSLRCSETPGSTADMSESGYGYAAYAAYATSELGNTASDESQSANPKDLKFYARVEVEFALSK